MSTTAMELREQCEQCLADLAPALQVDDEKLTALGHKLAATPAALELHAPRLPLTFGSRAQEINFYIILALADDPTCAWRGDAEKHFGCSYSHFLLKGFMAMYISGVDFTSDALSNLELYDISSNFDIPLTGATSKTVMPGVEQLQDHTLKPLAQSLTSRLRAIGTAAAHAHLRYPGDAVVDLLARQPNAAQPIAAAIAAIFPQLTDEVAIGAHLLWLHTSAHAAAARLHLCFRKDDDACNFHDIDTIPPLPAAGVEVPLFHIATAVCRLKDTHDDA
ncbi:hypothetical protein PTSG_01487 [Salpingoeca rosetta]|uniref:Uncharacterized protein n=1 Tax=Salpingoeca rosetta (strain ATCC 50818 / BSB-021) TaxID=946362 RepID=F2U0H2_SALR5|nr:uncharacterized protein PTSG_01487 [Salpingoeca rosetta]EGD80900.1 hypothetical protein PTSG_01487 [Salpingoeca rosetta]|eukprot:XP_004997461.1 hypothetical protein PTSG_01487 [Salpingoeca rosetta]